MKISIAEMTCYLVALLLMLVAIYSPVDRNWGAVLFYSGMILLFYSSYKWNTPEQTRRYPSTRFFRSPFNRRVLAPFDRGSENKTKAS